MNLKTSMFSAQESTDQHGEEAGGGVYIRVLSSSLPPLWQKLQRFLVYFWKLIWNSIVVLWNKSDFSLASAMERIQKGKA